MSTKQNIIDVTRFADDHLVAAATNRRINSLWEFDGAGSWRQIAEWKGKEITACCVVGDAVVCAALDGELYVLFNGQLHKHALPDPTMWIYAAIALDDGRALLGGDAGLVFCEPHSGELIHRRLSTYEIGKPGRTIHGITNCSGRIFIVGAKNLVLELQDDKLTELANRKAFDGRELLFQSAAYCNDRLWIAGAFGVLASLDNSGPPQVYEIDFADRNRGIGLRCHRGELMIFQDEIMLGQPGSWRPFIEGFRAPALVAVEHIAGDACCAITHTGESYVLQGDSIKSVPVF
jgi:hypothetical protein